MNTNSTLLLTIPVTLLFFLNGCIDGTRLSTQSVADLNTSRGTYNLILYGGHNAHDLQSVAILDRTDDPHTILPFGASFKYRIIENLSTADALARGERFLNDLIAYRGTEKREIRGPDQTVLGYELRPLFMPLATGLLGDILDSSYVLQEENRVVVYISFRGHYQDPMDSSSGNLLPGN